MKRGGNEKDRERDRQTERDRDRERELSEGMILKSGRNKKEVFRLMRKIDRQKQGTVDTLRFVY